jgi:hypothetical protein
VSVEGFYDAIVQGLRRNPLFEDAMRVANEALDTGEGEREALSLLVSALTPMDPASGD